MRVSQWPRSSRLRALIAICCTRLVQSLGEDGKGPNEGSVTKVASAKKRKTTHCTKKELTFVEHLPRTDGRDPRSRSPPPSCLLDRRLGGPETTHFPRHHVLRTHFADLSQRQIVQEKREVSRPVDLRVLSRRSQTRMRTRTTSKVFFAGWSLVLDQWRTLSGYIC